MSMEEDFYATIKLKTGEEIFTKVSASEEKDKTILIISNPVVIHEIKNRFSVVGYKFESWLKTTKDDMFVIHLDDVLTISESSDIDIITMYQSYIRGLNKEVSIYSQSQHKINRRMGYISNISDAKDLLEKLYKSS